MKIKVCGLREPANIEEVIALGIDYAGFIFYNKSPRNADGKAFKSWMDKNEAIFGKTKKVGVFVNAEIEAVLNAVHDYRLDFVQLHGSESPEYCRELKTYWSIGSLRSAQLIKAFGVDGKFDFNDTAAFEGLCSLFLFDTKGPLQGGNGVSFDWNLLGNYSGFTSYLLSGGIDEADAAAIRALPYKQLAGVDVNSRFELKPGLKDTDKIARLIAALRGD